VATYVVEAEAVPVAEALTLAVVGEGFGLLELREAPVELESLFLQLTRSGGAPA
jgi:hypothetical protein